MQTITTVGYGDIDIMNNAERLIGSFLMVVGVIMFTVANASLMTIADDLGDSEEYSEKVEALIQLRKQTDFD